MRKLCKEGTKTHEAVHVRLMTTENLLGRLKDSTERLQFITGREEDVIKDAREAAEPEISAVPVRPFKIPTSQIPTKSAPDPSGLFTLDPNPTPIEQLYKERPTPMVTTPGKWKRTFEDQKSQAEAAAENEPDRKRPKRDGKHSGVAQPRVEKENGVKDGDDEDESFTKAVEARAKAKEEKRLSRKDKKRKREESGESAETPKSPKGKKRKEKHKPEGTESATAAAPAADPVPVAKPDKAKRSRRTRDISLRQISTMMRTLMEAAGRRGNESTIKQSLDIVRYNQIQPQWQLRFEDMSGSLGTSTHSEDSTNCTTPSISRKSSSPLTISKERYQVLAHTANLSLPAKVLLCYPSPSLDRTPSHPPLDPNFPRSSIPVCLYHLQRCT